MLSYYVAGSFWNLELPEAGASMEANPPFVPSIMLQMADKIDQLLQEVSGGWVGERLAGCVTEQVPPRLHRCRSV